MKDAALGATGSLSCGLMHQVVVRDTPTSRTASGMIAGWRDAPNPPAPAVARQANSTANERS